jgi:6,7-dimethyl-8-ribityllumazine synthase
MTRMLVGDANYRGGRIAIVVSRFNESVTNRLLEGALATLKEKGVPEHDVDTVQVPGAFEIPLVAERMASSGRYVAVICLGAVIRGETSHDQYICRAVSHGIGQAALQTGVPILFGILTCDTLEQAIQRAGGSVGNKGSEAALAALEMADLISKLPR